MLHTMRLNTSPFNMIKSGEKTIELRLNDEKRSRISVGDEIEFISTENSEEHIYTIVKALHKFHSFKELYRNLPLTKCGYTQDDVCNARAEDMNMYYSVEQQNKYGVLGIELVLKNAL